MKFIGANSSGRWDFTPLIAEYSGYSKSKDVSIIWLSICAWDAALVICKTLRGLREDGFDFDFEDKYEKVRNMLTTFYL